MDRLWVYKLNFFRGLPRQTYNCPPKREAQIQIFLLPRLVDRFMPISGSNKFNMPSFTRHRDSPMRCHFADSHFNRCVLNQFHPFLQVHPPQALLASKTVSWSSDHSVGCSLHHCVRHCTLSWLLSRLPTRLKLPLSRLLSTHLSHTSLRRM